MKRTLGMLALAGLVFTLGCGKLKNLTNINVDIPYTQSVTVPTYDSTFLGAVPPAGYQLIPVKYSVPTNSQQYISGNNTTANDITSISMKSASIQMTAPAGAVLDFLNSVSITVSTRDLPPVVLAQKTSIPKGLNSVNLDVSVDSSLKTYFLEDTLIFQFDANINRVPPASSQITANITLHMVANPLN